MTWLASVPWSVADIGLVTDNPSELNSEPEMFRTYFEACDAEVTREEARLEIARHDVDGGFIRFLQEVGDRETYLGKEVLDWLGY